MKGKDARRLSQPEVAPTGDGSLIILSTLRAENPLAESGCTFRGAVTAICGPGPLFTATSFHDPLDSGFANSYLSWRKKK